MTSQITDELVQIVTLHMAQKRQSARLKKFQASIEALRTAEARGAWEGREPQKSEAGFYQGLADRVSVRLSPAFDVVGPNDLHNAEMCLCFGRPYSGPIPRVVAGKGRVEKEIAADVVEAWLKLCWIRHELGKQLDEARPKPVVTPIGLSPKVTMTLQGMNLDIDLPTIAPAEIESIKVQARHPKTLEPLFNKDGSPKMVTQYRVKWREGTQLSMSRFSMGPCCEACGKPIPSKMFVPIQAQCRKNGLIGLWIGVDCARNIFGVKDKGISK